MATCTFLSLSEMLESWRTRGRERGEGEGGRDEGGEGEGGRWVRRGKE